MGFSEVIMTGGNLQLLWIVKIVQLLNGLEIVSSLPGAFNSTNSEETCLLFTFNGSSRFCLVEYAGLGGDHLLLLSLLPLFGKLFEIDLELAKVEICLDKSLNFI